MLRLNPAKHVVRDTPVARYLRAKLRDPFIFTYYHLIHGTWTVCSWFSKSSGLCHEWEVWSGAATDCPDSVVQNVLAQRSEDTLKKLKARREQLYLAEHHDAVKQQEQADLHVSHRDWLKKRCSTASNEANPVWDMM